MMKKNKLILNTVKIVAVFLTAILSLAFTIAEGEKDGKRINKPSAKEGDSYRMFINKIDLPLNKTGVLADVDAGSGEGGKLNNKVFLFSGGFYMSGITDGKMWANAVASASRTEDYVAGTTKIGRSDPRSQIYVVESKDEAFSQSWQDWKDAVALGADFYDGDGDGLYNPVDLNANEAWDTNEDKPDLLGDVTAWCVYNDGVDPALRRFANVDPQGIEIRQTVFAQDSKAVPGNLIFIRYNITYVGNDKVTADKIDSVYFSMWADPDLGDANDDYVGCDTLLNAGFVYGTAADNVFGANPPCFLIDFFQGPPAYVAGETFTDINGNGVYDEGDISLDSATNVRGQALGIQKIPGARNLGLSSFVHYMQSDPDLGDPNYAIEARNYLKGLDRLGKAPNPCTWKYGSVTGFTCSAVNPRFWYSGDPVKGTGWLNIQKTDQRQMSNIGPFTLVKNQPVNIIGAYVVGQGDSPVNSVLVAKQNDAAAQLIFDNNFRTPPPPPAVEYTVTTGSNFIDFDLVVDTNLQWRSRDTAQGLNSVVEGFMITQYRTNSTDPVVDNVKNVELLSIWDKSNNIDSIYVQAPNGGWDLIVATDKNHQLDSAIYANAETGRIKLRITQDAFNNEPLVKGREYYFTVSQYTVNSYLYSPAPPPTAAPTKNIRADEGGYEQRESKIITVTMGNDVYDPALANGTADNTGKNQAGSVKYLVGDKSKLTGETYEVSFFPDTRSLTTPYIPFYRLTKNNNTVVLIDSSKNYDYDTTNYSGRLVDGFVLKVQHVTPSFKESQVRWEGTTTEWVKSFNDASEGVAYVGQDVPEGRAMLLNKNTNARSRAISADKLRQVELRFDQPGKAYRYINGYKGNNINRVTSYVLANELVAADTTGRGAVGKFGEHFVDVPFTAWSVDPLYNTEPQQLAVGFIEMARLPQTNGTPDGVWNPGDSVFLTSENIVIFDAPYSATGENPVQAGIGADPAVIVDLIKGYNLPGDQASIASSPWFNALYVVGISKTSADAVPSGKLVIPVAQHPLTSNDKFTFSTARSELSADADKATFEKVNVFPNPLFAYNPATSFNNGNPDEAFVTFSNLPTDVKVQIFTLSGTLIRTLTTADKSSPTSPFLRWNLQNEEGLRVASGMYLAIVDAPGFGEKVLKFAVIMPQKQIQRY